jgi:hypothetical protein
MSKPVPAGTPPPGGGPAGNGPGRGWRGAWHNGAGTHPAGPAGVRPPLTSERRSDPDDDEEDW